jgi:hypothetical protein
MKAPKKNIVTKVVKEAVKAAKKSKPLAEPKSAVKIVSSSPAGLRKIANQKSTMLAERAKSGQAAKTSASAINQKNKADKAQAIKLENEKIRAYFERTGKTPVPKKNPSKNGVRIIKNK